MCNNKAGKTTPTRKLKRQDSAQENMDTVSVLITDSVLGKNESCRCAVRCRPADPNLPSATLALVERQGDFALFFFSNLRQFVVESADLKLDNILPIASDFACEETEINSDSIGECVSSRLVSIINKDVERSRGIYRARLDVNLKTPWLNDSFRSWRFSGWYSSTNIQWARDFRISLSIRPTIERLHSRCSACLRFRTKYGKPGQWGGRVDEWSKKRTCSLMFK